MTERSGTIRRGVLFACLAMGNTTGVAQSVYKCHDAEGRSIFQSTPCADGTTQAWRREIDVAPTAATPTSISVPRAHTPAPRRASGKQVRRRPQPQGAVISLHRDAEACTRAKTQRDRALARRGLKRTFLELRRWDERVQEACR